MTESLRPLVTGWLGKLDIARKHRVPFDDVAEQCLGFYAGNLGFMYEDKFQKKFLGDMPISPRFRITINKAFELVSVVGPLIYHRNPTRSVKPYDPLELDPSLFGDSQDPQAQQAFQQASGQIQAEATRKTTQCQLLERYLNYTPREQPGGGLKRHAQDAVTECLVTGLGLLWPGTYRMPGSNRLLTGCFYDSNVNLLVDPDADSMVFGNAMWVSREHMQPTWEVERRFNLPAGSLAKAATLESGAAQGARRGDRLGRKHRAQGTTFDLITWHEVWSIGGVGTRLTGVAKTLERAFDEVVGDYAYICVAPNVPWPLNMPIQRFAVADDDDVREAFSWPVPYWMDRSWPFADLSFYRKPNTTYPIAPIQPALGELCFLNVMISHLANRVWSSSRDFIAVLKSAARDVKQILSRGEDLAVIELSEIHQDINKVVSFLRQPEVKFDAWKIVQQIFELFDRRTGLSELMYGQNEGQKVSRTATDVKAKQEKLSIRPDHMSGSVEDWMTQAAGMEKQCCYWSGVSGEDVRPLLGQVGSQLWDGMIANADPEEVAREMVCTIEANSARKPNKDRDAANAQAMVQVAMPVLDKHADATTDTEPLNNLIDFYGDSIDADTSGIRMGPRMPPPPQGPSPEEQEAEAEAGRKEEGHEQDMRHGEQQHRQQLAQDYTSGRLKLALDAAKSRASNGKAKA